MFIPGTVRVYHKDLRQAYTWIIGDILSSLDMERQHAGPVSGVVTWAAEAYLGSKKSESEED